MSDIEEGIDARWALKKEESLAVLDKNFYVPL